MSVLDVLETLIDIAWYAEHWRGILGLLLIGGGLFLAFGSPGQTAIGLIAAAIGLGFVIWEILTWFERED